MTISHNFIFISNYVLHVWYCIKQRTTDYRQNTNSRQRLQRHRLIGLLSRVCALRGATRVKIWKWDQIRSQLIFGPPFVKRFALCNRTVVCLSVCLSCPALSCLSAMLVYCGQTVWRIKMKLGRQAGLGPGHTALEWWGPSPLPQRGTAPNFRPISVAAKWLHGSRCHFGMELGLGPGDFVLGGNLAPLPKRGGEPPNFQPMFIVAKRLDGRSWYLAWR